MRRHPQSTTALRTLRSFRTSAPSGPPAPSGPSRPLPPDSRVLCEHSTLDPRTHDTRPANPRGISSGFARAKRIAPSTRGHLRSLSLGSGKTYCVYTVPFPSRAALIGHRFEKAYCVYTVLSRLALLVIGQRLKTYCVYTAPFFAHVASAPRGSRRTHLAACRMSRTATRSDLRLTERAAEGCDGPRRVTRPSTQS